MSITAMTVKLAVCLETRTINRTKTFYWGQSDLRYVGRLDLNPIVQQLCTPKISTIVTSAEDKANDDMRGDWKKGIKVVIILQVCSYYVLFPSLTVWYEEVWKGSKPFPTFERNPFQLLNGTLSNF
ncbi:hypothetical protein ACJMK2_032655 [Sinanodonta woodiana]|uniref:Uncharacterized protein n=1 Tax=Sinanodonta woodiana TaxID=1069815 RepID=A0ABD3X2L2_SINWO